MVCSTAVIVIMMHMMMIKIIISIHFIYNLWSKDQ